VLCCIRRRYFSTAGTRSEEAVVGCYWETGRLARLCSLTVSVLLCLSVCLSVLVVLHVSVGVQ